MKSPKLQNITISPEISINLLVCIFRNYLLVHRYEVVGKWGYENIFRHLFVLVYRIGFTLDIPVFVNVRRLLELVLIGGVLANGDSKTSHHRKHLL